MKFRNPTGTMNSDSTTAITLCSLLCSLSAFVTAQNDFYLTNQIVPDLLTTPPPGVLTVLYGGGVSVNMCNKLDPRNLTDPPMFSWEFTEEAKYALLMLDLDTLSRNSPVKRPLVHLLVMNIPANDVYSSDIVFDYWEPSPVWMTGLHRYVFLVYKQSPDIPNAEPLDRIPVVGRLTFDLDHFVKKYNLTGPIAGNCLQAEWPGF